MLQPNELVKNLKPGQTVFKVYALGDQSFVESIVFQRIDTRASRVIDSMGYWLVDDKNQYHSLHDMNAHTEPNDYNMHKLCDNEDSAEQYRFLCEMCDIGKRHLNDTEDDWWNWDEVPDEDL